MEDNMYETAEDAVRRTYTAAEAAAILGIHKNQVYQAVARGDLAAMRLRKRVLILKEPLDRTLAGA